MSGIEIVACIAAVITAFQGGAELANKIRQRQKQRRAQIEADRAELEASIKRDALESELQKSLEKGEHDLRCCQEMLGQQFGTAWPSDIATYYKLLEVKADVKAIQLYLELVYETQVDIKDLSKHREISDHARWTIKQIIGDFQVRMLPSIAYGSLPPLPTAMPLLPSRTTNSSFYTPAATPLHSSNRIRTETAMLECTARSTQTRGDSRPQHENGFPDSFRNCQWPSEPASRMENQGRERFDSQAAAFSSTTTNDARRPTATAAPSQQSNAQPGRTYEQILAFENPGHRDSFTSFATSTSSGTTTDSSPRKVTFRERFLGSHKSRRHSGFIEHSPGEIKSEAGPKNNWHGFCRGAWDISQDHRSALSEAGRPVSMYTQRTFLQCKHCAFKGNISPSSTGKTKQPDQRVFVADCGIRYRWLFLAKCHEKCSESAFNPLQDIRAHCQRATYRCMFCYLDGDKPQRYGGAESLMNHIYSRHRSGSISKRHLSRLNCIIGALASDNIDFDINIPEVAELEEAKEPVVLVADLLELDDT